MRKSPGSGVSNGGATHVQCVRPTAIGALRLKTTFVGASSNSQASLCSEQFTRANQMGQVRVRVICCAPVPSLPWTEQGPKRIHLGHNGIHHHPAARPSRILSHNAIDQRAIKETSGRIKNGGQRSFSGKHLWPYVESQAMWRNLCAELLVSVSFRSACGLSAPLGKGERFHEASLNIESRAEQAPYADLPLSFQRQ